MLARHWPNGPRLEWTRLLPIENAGREMLRHTDVATRKGIASHCLSAPGDPNSNINLPIGHGVTQIGLRVAFTDAGRGDALDRAGKRLLIRSIRHRPPPR